MKASQLETNCRPPPCWTSRPGVTVLISLGREGPRIRYTGWPTPGGYHRPAGASPPRRQCAHSGPYCSAGRGPGDQWERWALCEPSPQAPAATEQTNHADTGGRPVTHRSGGHLLAQCERSGHPHRPAAPQPHREMPRSRALPPIDLEESPPPECPDQGPAGRMRTVRAVRLAQTSTWPPAHTRYRSAPDGRLEMPSEASTGPGDSARMSAPDL